MMIPINIIVKYVRRVIKPFVTKMVIITDTSRPTSEVNVYQSTNNELGTIQEQVEPKVNGKDVFVNFTQGVRSLKVRDNS
jgi:hypothetical protein